MPKCEGLPDGPCPDRKQDNTVKLGEGDLMLCKPCDKVRVEQFLSSKSSTSDASNPIDFAQVSRKKSKTKAQRDKEPNNTVSVQSLDAVTVPTDASASTDDDMNSEMELRQRVEQLTVTVTKQNETITRLSTHLQFVLSFLDIQQTENNKLELSSSVWPTVAESMLGPTDSTVEQTAQDVSHVSRLSDVVSRTVQMQEKHKCEEMMAAVYIEQRNKAKRTSSFMISGLPPDNAKGDNELVVELCRSEFSVDVDIISSKRVGKTRDLKPQLLMVNLKTEAEAQNIIRSARQLRKSHDSYVKANVYINANLTPAEAKASYELRQRRWQAARHQTIVDSTYGTQQSATGPHQQQPQQQQQNDNRYWQ